MPFIQKLRQIRRDALWVPKMLVNICSLKRKYPRLKIYTYRSLVKSIIKRNDVCHVIATGHSALDSYKAGIVKADDYIIGFNFAAFLPYKFDFYFFEETFRTDGFFLERTKGITELLNKRMDYISNLTYKNARATCPKLMVKFLPDIDFAVVMDKQLMYENVKKLFAPPACLMPQYSSTVITAVMLAYHAGFKNIVVHGLDFSGPHVYHDEEVQKEAGMEAPTQHVPMDKIHMTASTQELIWPDIIKMFQTKNANIFCASPKSNFKKYAPLWENN